MQVPDTNLLNKKKPRAEFLHDSFQSCRANTIYTKLLDRLQKILYITLFYIKTTWQPPMRQEPLELKNLAQSCTLNITTILIFLQTKIYTHTFREGLKFLKSYG